MHPISKRFPWKSIASNPLAIKLNSVIAQPDNASGMNYNTALVSQKLYHHVLT